MRDYYTGLTIAFQDNNYQPCITGNRNRPWIGNDYYLYLAFMAAIHILPFPRLAQRVTRADVYINISSIATWIVPLTVGAYHYRYFLSHKDLQGSPHQQKHYYDTKGHYVQVKI